MEEKMQILLDRIKFQKDHYNYFEDAKLTKIKISKQENSWQIFIEKEKVLPIEILEELENQKYTVAPNVTQITINYTIKEQNLEEFQKLYSYVLEEVKEKLKPPVMFKKSLIVEDSKLVLVANNKLEEEKLNNVVEEINQIYHRLGLLSEIPVILKEGHKVTD